MIIITLSIASYFILRTPKAQTYVTGLIANKLSKDLGTKISIGGVDISWFLNGVLEDVLVEDLHGNSMIVASRIEFGYRSFSRKKNKIVLSKAEVDNLIFAVRRYKNEEVLNLQFLIDYFTSSDTTASTSAPMVFSIQKAKLSNCRFIYDVEDEAVVEKGMDYNHLDIRNINAEVNNFKLDGQLYFADIRSLSGKDTSGLILSHFEGNISTGPQGSTIENMIIQTPSSYAALQLGLEYQRWPNWLDFIDSVSFNSTIDSLNIALIDLLPFSSSLEKTNIRIQAKGEVKGPVSNLRLRDFQFSTGGITHFDGRAKITGLPNIENSFFDIKMNEFVSNAVDVSNIVLPGGDKIDLPSNLRKLQAIEIKGRFTGFYNDFVANATFKTALGNFSTDLLLKPLKNSKKISYQGKISMNNFQIGELIEMEQIRNLSLKGSVNGQGIDENAVAEVDILISNIRISQFDYKYSSITGSLRNKEINARIQSHDSLFELDAAGYYSFADSLPDYEFKADVKNARVGRLFLYQTDTLGTISGRLAVKASGNNADNLRGNIFMDSLYYHNQNKTYFGEQISLNSDGTDLSRRISLKSKFVDGSINGSFKFAELGDIYTYILQNFIPVLFNNSNQSGEKILANSNFDFDFNFKNINDLTEIFVPDLELAQNSKLKGFFDAQRKSLSMSFVSPYLDYDGNRLSNLKLRVINYSDTFNIKTYADELRLSNGMYFDSVAIIPSIFRDEAIVNINLGTKNNRDNSLIINAKVNFLDSNHFSSNIDYMSVWFRDSNWVVEKPNSLEYRNEFLKIDNLEIQSKENGVKVHGLVSNSPQDKLNFDFKDFDISFFNYYLEQYYLSLKGEITGSFSISNIFHQFNYTAEFGINNFVFNDTKLGTASIFSTWNPHRNAVSVEMVSEIELAGSRKELLEVNGFYYPELETDNLDLTAKVNDIPLKAVSPFLSSFSSKIEGTASGKVNIVGEIDNPVILGSVQTDVTHLTIDYLNTSYRLNDKIIFTKNYFGYENARLYDLRYNGGNSHQGLLNFKLNHRDFKDMSISFDVVARELDMLNITKKDNELFYGYAVGNGTVKITGPIDDLYFNIDVKPLKGTKIAIPMSETSSSENTEFIRFVIKDSTKIKSETDEVDESYALTMDMRFDMTPEATVQLVMDEQVGDIITANGNGIIRINVDKEFNVNMFGSYQIERGDYLFTMQNIINKHFILDPGGSITWEGDLLDARIDMKAKYQTEAKLFDLLQMVDTSDQYKRRSKVDCIINLAGNLASPSISFGIDLPNESNDTRELVNMMLYTSGGNANQDIINKNFISLIMLGKFQAPAGYTQGTNPNALAANASELLASQVSNWLNKMSDEVDIGFTYIPGDEATSQEIAVALSYQAFNDRLMIDGKFGTGGENKGSESETRIVGDLNIEWAITKDKNLRAKVYNQTNYEDPLTRKAPYTQGAGIVFRKEFDSFEELFKRSRPRESAQSQSTKSK